MSKKRGLSLEEKRVKLMEIFHDRKDVFLLKDLEKIAPKEKGIPMQTVKEVLMSLVADDMVDTDKIGVSVYFWAFPSKAFASLDDLEKSLKDSVAQNDALDCEIKKLLENSKEDAQESKRRIEIQDELTELSLRKSKAEAIISQYKDCDPEILTTMEEELEMAVEAVERWTDNVFTIQSYLKNKFQMPEKDIKKAFNIPEDFDYFQEPE